MEIQEFYNLNQLILDVGLLILFFVLILLAKIINNLLSPYSIDTELTQKDNNALSISLCGYFLAITFIFIGAMIGPQHEIVNMDVIKQDLIGTAKYVLLGILLLNISRFINDKLILYKFSNVKEIIEDRNSGTGAAQFGSYVASGLIIAGSVHGEGGGVLTTIAFFALGQVALVVFTYLYNLITPFDIHKEIENDNVAAGIAFGGILTSLGIVLMTATSGNFYSWKENLTFFAIDSILICVLLPLGRFLFDKLIIPNSSLNHEISHDRNNGAALLEAVFAISIASVLCFIIS
jgi:uncharacterized membrane protein YjfL (UPF0719 family)